MLRSEQRQLIELTRTHKVLKAGMKAKIAQLFGLEHAERVNLSKAFEYLSSDSVLVERFLDSLEEERLQFERSDSGVSFLKWAKRVMLGA